MLCSSHATAGTSVSVPFHTVLSLQRWEDVLQWVENKSRRNLGLLGTLIVSPSSRHTQKEMQ